MSAQAAPVDSTDSERSPPSWLDKLRTMVQHECPRTDPNPGSEERSGHSSKGNSEKVTFSKCLDQLKSPVIIGLAAFFVALYASVFYPGYLTADSLYMLSQGTGQEPLTNWHPPFIVLTWGILFSFYKSAGGVWLIQIALYITAAVFFSLRLRNCFLAQASFIVLLAYPPIFTNMGALWKDCWVVSTTLLCAGCSIDAIEHKKMKSVILTGFYFAVSLLIRVDYAIIAAPFVISAVFFGMPAANSLQKKIRMILFFLLLGFGVVLVNQWAGSFVSQRRNPWVNAAIWDIAGIEHYSRTQSSADGYNSKTSDPIVFGPYKMFDINLPQEPLKMDPTIESKQIFSLWLEHVSKHPSAYIKHRLHVAEAFLGIGTPEVHYPFPRAEMSSSPLTQRSERSQLNIDLYWFFDAHANGAMYRYWRYVGVAAVLLILSMACKTTTSVEVSIFLSVLFSASRFLILPATDFRYGLWMVIGSIALTFRFLDRCAAGRFLKIFNTNDSSGAKLKESSVERT